MAISKKSRSSAGQPEGTSGCPTPTKFHDRNLLKVNPNKEQFEPLAGEGVPQLYKMGGGA